MSENKNDNWQIILDQLLVFPPEDVLAMFQNDLRRNFHPIQAALDLLADKEFAYDDPDQLLEILQGSSKGMDAMLEYNLRYLKARQNMKNPDEKNFTTLTRGFLMPDEQHNIPTDLDQLLLSSPDDVLAMFQNDLTYFTQSIEAGLEILSNKEIPQDYDRTVEFMKQRTESINKAIKVLPLF